MTNNILDLNKIDLTPDISSIKNDNHVDLNNYSFEECKEKIKESYIRNISYKKFKLKKSNWEKFWSSILIFSIISFFLTPGVFIKYDFGLIFFFLIYFTSSSYIFISVYKIEKHEKKSKLKYFNVIKNKFIKNIDYFLPLSKNELSIILKNNNNLKKYVAQNYNIIYSQYEIDKILGTSSNNNFFEDGKEINDTFLNVSSIEFMNIKDAINNEQKEAIFGNYDCNEDNQYKVTYSIENGPQKEVIFKYTHCDKELFKKHIRNSVESEYGREFEILSIDLIK